MHLSQRAERIQESPIRKLKPYADQAQIKGLKIYYLNIGQPDIPTPPEIMEAYKNYPEEILAYGPAQGLDFYRKNLVNYYKNNGIRIEADDIIVTNSGSEAIIFAILAIANPGEEIIIPEPFYTNYNGFADMADIKIKALTTRIENSYQLPSDKEIKSLINPKTKAILICNPNNPTGAVYPQADLQRIIKIAQEHDLFIISDEVYREFVYDNLKHYSFLNFLEAQDRVIMVDSISKRYSACGARIGCLISKNKEVMKSVLKFAQARLCPPTIDQWAANQAISLGEEYFQKILAEYDARRNLVFDELNKIEGVVCQKPEGAFYVMAKLPIENAEDFVIWLLQDFNINNETLMLAPAENFYATPGLGKNEVRIAYILNQKDLQKALNILKQGLEEYKNIKK